MVNSDFVGCDLTFDIALFHNGSKENKSRCGKGKRYEHRLYDGIYAVVLSIYLLYPARRCRILLGMFKHYVFSPDNAFKQPLFTAEGRGKEYDSRHYQQIRKRKKYQRKYESKIKGYGFYLEVKSC